MLCFFMFLLMTTVSSAPMDLMSEKQASKSVTEMMSQPLLSQALLQNKTFLSELAKADPGTLNTIMGLLNDLLDASIAASIAFTTDVNTALIDKNAKTTILASATTNQTNANNAKTAADSAFTKATSDFDAAVIHHTTMQDELTDKQPGVDAESDTLRSTIAIVRTLLPECPQGEVYNECGTSCEPSCDNLAPVCISQCVTICSCPDNKVRGPDGACISDSSCPPEDLPYKLGSCMPSGHFTANECCPSGYIQIPTLSECGTAFNSLASSSLSGAIWGANAERESRPSGCFWHMPNNNVHFNPINVIGNGKNMLGQDNVICMKV